MKPFAVALLAVGLACLGTTVFAAPINLNWGAQINSGQCSTDGDLVINVTSSVTNDIDSRVGGGWWAVDNYNKNIQVWSTADPTVFCIRVLYLGRFDAVAGGSPQNGVALAGGEKGSFEGGYWATLTSVDLKETPNWKTRGNIGDLDYQCNVTNGNCLGAVSWIEQYFDNFDSHNFAYNWWGWTYHGGKNGTWVNASPGNEGDIVDK